MSLGQQYIWGLFKEEGFAVKRFQRRGHVSDDGDIAVPLIKRGDIATAGNVSGYRNVPDRFVM